MNKYDKNNVEGAEESETIRIIKAQQYYNRGKDYFNKGDNDEAIDNFKKAIELDQKYTAAYFDLAMVYNKLESDDDMIDNLDKVIELDINNINAYLRRADAYSCKGFYDRAIKDLKKVLDLDKNNEFAKNYLAMINTAIKQDYDKAVEYDTEIIESDPDKIDAYFSRGQSNLLQKNFDAAIDDFTKCIDLMKNSNINYYKNSSDINLTLSDIHCTCGKAYSSKNYEKMTDNYFETLIKDDKVMENFNKAIEYYNKAIEINDNDAQIYHERGVVYTSIGDREKANGNIDKAMEYYDKAINDYVNAVKIESSPYTADGYYNMGIVYEKKGERDKASEQFIKAIELDPKNKNFLRNTIQYLIECEKKGTDISAGMSHIVEYSKKLKIDSVQISSWFGSDAENIVKEIQNKNESDSFQNILKKHNFDESNKQLYNEYKDVYIKANNVVNCLIVDEEIEYGVAHYTSIDTAQKLLFKNSKKCCSEKCRSEIRQCSLKNTNDPTEGKTLFDYLQNENFSVDKENVSSDYEAFVTCFTFNHNHLNQFRLYGKEKSYECTGLSMIFKSDFFSKQEELIAPDIITDNKKTETEKKETVTKVKPCLYRCVYIDPDTKQIVSVGQRDKYTFYRNKKYEEESKQEFESYQNYIDQAMIKLVDAMFELEKAIKQIKNRDPALIVDLLINLRYLVKHYAFKEEQECRIIQVKSTTDLAVKSTKKNRRNRKNRLYIEVGDISNYVKKIYFGPCVTDIGSFEKKLNLAGLDTKCEKSNLPYSA